MESESTLERFRMYTANTPHTRSHARPTQFRRQSTLARTQPNQFYFVLNVLRRQLDAFNVSKHTYKRTRFTWRLTSDIVRHRHCLPIVSPKNRTK